MTITHPVAVDKFNYPPSSPPPPHAPPPLQGNTRPELDHSFASRRAPPSPSKFSRGSKPLYQLPASLDAAGALGSSQSRARPGGLAALTGSSDGRKSPSNTPGKRPNVQSRATWARRDSSETSIPAPSARRGSEHASVQAWRENNGRATPPAGPRVGTSVYSGREGSIYSMRNEARSAPSEADLRRFAHHCREFFFSPAAPPESADFISTTLAALPPAHRAAYTRLQSSIRSLAHLHHLRVRISSFHALISSTVASASLPPAMRSHLSSATARAERRERLHRFVTTWCTSRTGGVEPFFRALWSVFRAQSRGDEKRGGGGGKRVVWEIDDAVFLESGGTEFMHEAVIMLKGVLGFTDQPLTSAPRLRRIRTIPRSYSTSKLLRPQLTNMSSRSPTLPQFNNEPREEEVLTPVDAINAQTDEQQVERSRSRATSDPFIDPRISPIPGSTKRGPAPPPPPSRRHASQQRSVLVRSDSDGVSPLDTSNVEAPLLPRRDSDSMMVGRSQSYPIQENVIVEDDDYDDPTEDDIAAEEAELNKPRFRLWTFPSHITDQECQSLMASFPKYIRARDVRFPFVRPGRGIKDLESGTTDGRWIPVFVEGREVAMLPREEDEGDEGVVRGGTGRMWVGAEGRSSGWTGGFWFRFRRWWRWIFGAL